VEWRFPPDTRGTQRFTRQKYLVEEIALDILGQLDNLDKRTQHRRLVMTGN
jgi:hypothetical protein